MPSRYVALLRGINVGGHKKVAMADLRSVLAGLGCTGVATLLQSGNAVFTSGRADPVGIAVDIEQAVLEALGVGARCLVKPSGSLQAVIDGNPLLEVGTDWARMMALFLFQPPDPALLAEWDPVALDPGNVGMGDGVIYQWCPDGILAAPAVGALVEKRLKVPVTARNWNTVTKLGAMLDG